MTIALLCNVSSTLGLGRWFTVSLTKCVCCIQGVCVGSRLPRVWLAGGGGWHKALVSDCLPLAAPISLSPLLILTLCGPERVLVVSTKTCLGGGGQRPEKRFVCLKLTSHFGPLR